MARKNKVLIVDARNLLWRNADAFSDLTANVDGERINTGGMYGFVAALLRIKARYGGRVMIAWEGSKNFRFDLYPDYKKRPERTDQEKELAEEVIASEGRLVELLSRAGVRQYYGVRCEADDVMGRISTMAESKRKRTIIYTGDSDLRQMVGDYVTVVAPGRGKDALYDRAAVKAKHGVRPERLPVLKALAGDSSDNIPGLPGIGEKTAAALVALYGTLQAVNFAANPEMGDDSWPVAERFKDIVWSGRQKSLLFLKLTTIKTDVGLRPVPIDKDKAEVVRLLKLYKFRSLSTAAELFGIMDLGS